MGTLPTSPRARRSLAAAGSPTHSQNELEETTRIVFYIDKKNLPLGMNNSALSDLEKIDAIPILSWQYQCCELYTTTKQLENRSS
jgi:hypothetical protein